ncbi:protein translocase subunit SecD [soil metagenome]
MARKTYRPTRTLTWFFIALVVSYLLAALATSSWKPALGLDLQGGTRITLIAEETPTAEQLDEARSIINQRVNGSGVAEAEVTRQGSNLIVVEIPGKNRQDLVDVVERQAQMQFRLVACSAVNGAVASTSDCDVSGVTATTPSPVPDQSTATDKNTKKSSGASKERAGLFFEKSKNKDKAGSASTDAASEVVTPTDAASDSPSAAPTDSGQTASETTSVDDAIAFIASPPAESLQDFANFTCPTDGGIVDDNPTTPLVTCDPEGTTVYLLSPVVIAGTDVSDASYGIPQNDVHYVVNLDFNSNGRGIFADVTGRIADPSGNGRQFAIVLDGQVISAPTASQRINGGAQISGSSEDPFTLESAKALSTSIKFGALPIKFKDDVSVEVIGPTLAGNQLTAGLTAGALGLVLVMLYCLVYYRALGLVVIASFFVAAAWVYALVLLLSETAGFTLTLPGIAGLIIAVGVTADSFIIFFERIRDEMRDGKSMRVAVESGWIRARQTRVAANVVQLLSALILYIFATGVVKGFGFALGLTTLIDLAVLFWFTKPMVSLLARYRFFNGGGKYSGLSVETLGAEPRRATPARVGGKA